MLSKEEFNRQRAEKLASVNNENDYQSNRSVYNRRINNAQMKAYEKELKSRTLLYIISIPFCVIIALAASMALVLMGVVTETFFMWLSTIIMFIILYSGILAYSLRSTVRQIDVNVKNNDSEHNWVKY